MEVSVEMNSCVGIFNIRRLVDEIFSVCRFLGKRKIVNHHLCGGAQPVDFIKVFHHFVEGLAFILTKVASIYGMYNVDCRLKIKSGRVVVFRATCFLNLLKSNFEKNLYFPR